MTALPSRFRQWLDTCACSAPKDVNDACIVCDDESDLWVQMPVCRHQFHRKCIERAWDADVCAQKCMMCRRDFANDITLHRERLALELEARKQYLSRERFNLYSAFQPAVVPSSSSSLSSISRRLRNERLGHCESFASQPNAPPPFYLPPSSSSLPFYLPPPSSSSLALPSLSSSSSSPSSSSQQSTHHSPRNSPRQEQKDSGQDPMAFSSTHTTMFQQSPSPCHSFDIDVFNTVATPIHRSHVQISATPKLPIQISSANPFAQSASYAAVYPEQAVQIPSTNQYLQSLAPPQDSNNKTIGPSNTPQ